MENVLFGTTETVVIHAQLNDWCHKHLGSAVAQVRFVAAGHTYVTGLLLADGRQVVVRAHAPTTSQARLLAVYDVQHRLAAAGFPCPRPLTLPARLGSGWANAEDLMDAGACPDATQPEIRDAMAQTLALMLHITRTFDAPTALREERPAWVDFRNPGLWPTPHLSGLDFPVEGAEARWIDGVAMTAKHRLMQLLDDQAVPGHSDYCAQNMLVAGRRIVTIYDWDSLVAEREEVLVGLAAATFPAHGGGYLALPVVPSPQQRWAFVETFERARGVAFTVDQRRHILAASAWVTSYNARVMHAFGQRQRHVAGTHAFALRELADELAAA